MHQKCPQTPQIKLTTKEALLIFTNFYSLIDEFTNESLGVSLFNEFEATGTWYILTIGDQVSPYNKIDKSFKIFDYPL